MGKPNSVCPTCGALRVWQGDVEVCPYIHDDECPGDPVVCPACDGDGEIDYDDDEDPETCSECDGSGVLL